MTYPIAYDTDSYRRRAPYRRPRHRRAGLAGRIADRLLASVVLVPVAGVLTAAALTVAALAAHSVPAPLL